MRRNVLAVVLFAVMILPAVAEEAKEKKGKGKQRDQNVAAQLLKQLEPVGLSDDQQEKITAMGKTVSAEIKKIRDEAGITPELMKKRSEAAKSLADSDKKGKERAAAIDEAAGFSKEHAAAMAKMNGLRTKMIKEVVEMLSDEQKEKLPKQLARAAQAGKGKKPGGKKNKKDAA